MPISRPTRKHVFNEPNNLCPYPGSPVLCISTVTAIHKQFSRSPPKAYAEPECK